MLVSVQYVDKNDVERNYEPGDYQQQPGKPVLPVADCA